MAVLFPAAREDRIGSSLRLALFPNEAAWSSEDWRAGGYNMVVDSSRGASARLDAGLRQAIELFQQRFEAGV